MKLKVILAVAIAALCAVAIFRRSSPDRAQPSDPRGAGDGAPAPIANDGAARDPHAGHVHSQPGAQTVRPLHVEGDSRSLLEAIARALASGEPEGRDLACTNLLPALVRTDARAAGRFAETNNLEGTREIVLQHVAQLLASQNLTNALAWAGGLQFDHERESTLTDVCLQLAQSDPAAAVALRAGMLTENQSYDALEDMTFKWAEKDLNATLAWIKNYPADERRNQLLGRVAYLYSQTAPEDAARMVIEDMVPGDSQNEAVMSVLHQWALRNPAAAGEWVSRFPESPLRQRALSELAGIASSRNQAAPGL